MALNSVICTDVPLRNYSVTPTRHRRSRTVWMYCL